MKIKNTNDLIKESDIQEFEKTINTALPQEYRNFLLEFNGGQPVLYIFPESEVLHSIPVNTLYGLKVKESYNDLEKNYAIYDGRIMNSFIAIGSDPSGNQFCLGITGIFKDKVYIWDHNQEIDEWEFIENKLPENMYLLSDSFHNFINQLEEDTEA
ncbi:SMI1/KNR4 family protein [Sulfurimonas sp.]|uniref:SMI1/KNR4 family protein n=1 Tax=Sulfurimonas sp. TaxID=2022749 RepID=UPI003D0ECA7C